MLRNVHIYKPSRAISTFACTVPYSGSFPLDEADYITAVRYLVGTLYKMRTNARSVYLPAFCVAYRRHYPFPCHKTPSKINKLPGLPIIVLLLPPP